MQRQFFSGNSIEQAVMSAARHYKVDPDTLAYSVRDKKHGFLNIRRRVVIEVDPDNLVKSEPEVEEIPAVPAVAVESRSEGPEEAGDSVTEPGSSLEDDESAEEVAAGKDHDSGDQAEEDSAHDEVDDDVEASDDEGDDYPDDDEDDEYERDRRPKSRRGRGRRGSSKNRRDVKLESFSWDDENDGWDEEDLDGEEESRELVAVEICLERILDVMDLEIEYSIVEGETVEVEFSGEDSDFLIEDDGKVLKAIEHIVPRMARAVIGRSLSVHVDCEGFRADHEASLKKVANQAAEEVVRRGRAKTLSPMNPADRRIVHLALVDHPDVDTVSQGHGFMKRVKVVPAAS